MQASADTVASNHSDRRNWKTGQATEDTLYACIILLNVRLATALTLEPGQVGASHECAIASAGDDKNPYFLVFAQYCQLGLHMCSETAL